MSTDSRLARAAAWARTPRGAAAAVGVVCLVAAVGHIVIVNRYDGPWVYDDELGYQKLAQSIGTHGDLALFGKRGLSYSPLYPLVLSPLYALHLSAVAAYHWTKILNALLMAVAVFPIYRIARYVLPRGLAVAAALLSALAPLMLYSALEMSESLSYPLCMFALWAMLVTIRSPSLGHDSVVLAACILATASRLQFVVLLPAALAAIIVDGLLDRDSHESWLRRTQRALRAHPLLTAAAIALVLLGIAAFAGTSALSLAGRYSDQRSLPFPSPWLIAKLAADHVAGLVFAAGVIPFTGTLVAAYLWRGRSSRPSVSSFAALSLSMTTTLLLLAAAASYGQSYAYRRTTAGDLPRIHERYLIYVLPLFLIAMLATTRVPRSTALVRAGLLAAVVTGLLPLVIPYHEIMNNTVAVDTFGLAPFAGATAAQSIQALPHAALIAVAYALFLSLAYALARPNAVLVVALVAVVFAWVSTKEHHLLDVAARYSTSQSLPARPGWVDAAGPKTGVVVFESARKNAILDLAVGGTAFYNLSVSRLYYPCERLLSPDFGEVQAAPDSQGVLRDSSGPLVARYAVAPIGAGLVGRVIARDRPGRLVLVEPPGGILRIAAGVARVWSCPPPRS